MHTRTRTTTNFSSGTPAKGHGVRVHGSVGKPPEASTGTVLRHHGEGPAKGTTTTTHGSVGKAQYLTDSVGYHHEDASASPARLPRISPYIAAKQNLLLGILESFSDAADLVSYLRHVGFDACALRNPRDLSAAWLGHYRRAQADYDIDRACRDLATWPPIASRIRELQHQATSTRAPSPKISGV